MPYKDPSSPASIEAARASRRKHYEKNKEQYYANNRKKWDEMSRYIDEIKKSPCMDCGVSYPAFVMDFDHRDQSLKNLALGIACNEEAGGCCWKK